MVLTASITIAALLPPGLSTSPGSGRRESRHPSRAPRRWRGPPAEHRCTTCSSAGPSEPSSWTSKVSTRPRGRRRLANIDRGCSVSNSGPVRQRPSRSAMMVDSSRTTRRRYRGDPAPDLDGDCRYVGRQRVEHKALGGRHRDCNEFARTSQPSWRRRRPRRAVLHVFSIAAESGVPTAVSPRWMCNVSPSTVSDEIGAADETGQIRTCPVRLDNDARHHSLSRPTVAQRAEDLVHRRCRDRFSATRRMLPCSGMHDDDRRCIVMQEPGYHFVSRAISPCVHRSESWRRALLPDSNLFWASQLLVLNRHGANQSDSVDIARSRHSSSFISPFADAGRAAFRGRREQDRCVRQVPSQGHDERTSPAPGTVSVRSGRCQ